MHRWAHLATVLTIIAVVVACGDSSGSDSSTTATASTSAPTAATTTDAPVTFAPTTMAPTTTARPATTNAPTSTASPTTTASPGIAVEIDADYSEFFATGTFTATGSAVDAGLVCAAGVVTHEGFTNVPERQKEQWVEVFVCDDDSGSFSLDTRVSYSVAEVLYEWGTWTVLEGTGTYAGLTGDGKIEVTCDAGTFESPCHEDMEGGVIGTN